MRDRTQDKPSFLVKAFNNIADFSRKHAENFGPQFYLFACFGVAYYGIPFQFWAGANEAQEASNILLRGMASSLSFSLLFKDLLNKRLQRFFPLYWHVVIMFCLPVFSTYTLLKGIMPHPWTALSVFLLSVLTDWVTFIILFVVGTMLGAALAVDEAREFIMRADTLGSAEVITVYTCAILIFITSLFLRNRDKLVDERIKAYADLSGHIVHEIRKPLAYVRNSCEAWNKNNDKLIVGYNTALKEGLIKDEINPLALDFIKNIPIEIIKTVNDGLLFAEILLMQTQLHGSRKDFVIESAKNTIKKVVDRWGSGRERTATIILSIDNDFKYLGVPVLVEHIFFELLRNSEHFLHGKNDPKIKIWFEEDRAHQKIHFKDNGCGIPGSDIKSVFKSGFSTRSRGTGIGLSYCNRAATMMDGFIFVKSKVNEFTEFVLVFPKLTEKE